MRLGLIGDSDATRQSGVYRPGDNISAKIAISKVSRYAYDNIYNALSNASGSQGFCFSEDGTKLYATSSGTRTTAKVVQYNLSEPFNVSTATYQSSKDITIGDYEPAVTGIDISSDGTRLFFTGTTNDSIWSCTLSNPYDLATAKVDVRKVYVGTQDATANTPVFGDSGTKMYVMGATNDRVYQYDLTTAWDVSTATYSNKSFLITQDATPQGIFFKDDGLTFYVVGQTTDTVYQYDINPATPWDISTASYANKSKAIGTEETNPRALFFKPDGLKMYVIGTTGDDVNEYDLSPAWDVSTATFLRVSATIGEATPTGLWFKDDGFKMYVTGQSNDTVREFTLSAAWNVSTISFSKSLSVGFETAPTGATFKDDGTKLYVLGQTNDCVYEIQLGTAWDTGTAKGFIYVGSVEGAPRAINIRSSGTTIYLGGTSSNVIRTYTLTTAFELGTATATGATLAAGSAYGFWVSPDGTYGLASFISISGFRNLSTVRGIRRFNMTAAHNLSTASFVAVELLDLNNALPYSVSAAPDGSKLFVGVDTFQGVHQFSLRFA